MSLPKPGIELDRLVATKVLGWYQESDIGGPRMFWKDGNKKNSYLKCFSTDIGAAWDLVRKFKLCIYPNDDKWTVTSISSEYKLAKGIVAGTAAHAICLAALNIARQQPKEVACIITYRDNVLRCGRFNSRKKNYDAARAALAMLIGRELEDEDFEEGGGTVGFYRSEG